MLKFLKRVFFTKQRPPIDPEDIVEELFATDFSDTERRFEEERAESYLVEIKPGALELRLLHQSVFAWTVNPIYRYRNFVLEASFTLGRDHAVERNGERTQAAKAGTMAGGIAFRYLSDSTFYCALVSDQGLVRVDSIINGNPIPVLGWTAPSSARNEEIKLRIIARDTSFTIVVNDAWVAECEDDTIQAAGKTAIAAQAWSAAPPSSITVTSFAIESRELEVEAAYTRWNQYIKIPAESRAALAETWFAMSKYVPALIELKKIWREREARAEECLLACGICLAQRLVAEAEGYARMAAERSGPDSETRAKANAELAGILYYQNRADELESLLSSLPREEIDSSAFLSNLLGHSLSGKGERLAAAEAYGNAARVNPDQGLFHLNRGKELQAAGLALEARASLGEAARAFLAAGEYDDLAAVLEFLAEGGEGDPSYHAYRGKYLYAVGERDAARASIERALQIGCADSACHYLLGMILRDEGDIDGAIAQFNKAIVLEGAFAPYRFRLAETLFNAGRDADAEIARALEADPDSPWAQNLAALSALKKGDLDAADRCLERARRALPAELSIRINQAELRRRQGRLDEALGDFDKNDAQSLWAGANLLVEEGRNEEADEWYREAQRKNPFDPALLADRAANCLELDLLSEADDLLGRSLELMPTSRAYLLIAYLSGRKGEHARAEVALQRGLEEFPEDGGLLSELAMLYLRLGKREKARETVRLLERAGLGDKAREIEGEIELYGTSEIACSGCDRSWRVPRDIAPQGSLRIHDEPPDEMPAGTCPECGRHFCIGCARETLGEDARFRCARCGVPLKLIDQGIIWVLSQWQERERGRTEA